MNKNICVFICFLVGVLVFMMIRGYCSCDIEEGYCCESGEKPGPAPPTPVQGVCCANVSGNEKYCSDKTESNCSSDFNCFYSAVGPCPPPEPPPTPPPAPKPAPGPSERDHVVSFLNEKVKKDIARDAGHKDCFRDGTCEGTVCNTHKYYKQVKGTSAGFCSCGYLGCLASSDPTVTCKEYTCTFADNSGPIKFCWRDDPHLHSPRDIDEIIKKHCNLDPPL
jgi:hypothetical protein